MNAVQTAKKQVYSSKDPITTAVGKDVSDLMGIPAFPEGVYEDTTYIAGSDENLPFLLSKAR